MSSHFSVLGVESREEVDAFIKGTYEAGIVDQYPDPSEKPSVKLMSGNAGLWVHTSNGCFVPLFQADNRVRIRAVEWLEDPDGCPFCANLGVEVLKPDGEVNYPLAITFGNIRKARAEIQLGEELELPIVGFVESIQKWDDLESLKTTEEAIPTPIENYTIQFQPGWFFPLGPYSAMEQYRNSAPRAGFYAWAEKIEVHTNETTGRTYRSVQARCGSAVYTVLLDDSQYPDLLENQIIYAECWMCVAN